MSFSRRCLLCLLLIPGAAGAKPMRIVTLGDSITRGVRQGVKPEETFSALLQEQLRQKKIEAEVINVGIGGERTDQALARLAKAVVALKPNAVVIMYGTNDSYVDKGRKTPRLSAEQYGANLKALAGELRKHGIEPILMTPPRWGGKAGLNGAGEHPNILLEQYVKVCREAAKETKTPLADHFAAWSKAAAAGTDIGQWTTDECHPNPRGHREIASLLLPAVLEVVRKIQPD